MHKRVMDRQREGHTGTRTIGQIGKQVNDGSVSPVCHTAKASDNKMKTYLHLH